MNKEKLFGAAEARLEFIRAYAEHVNRQRCEYNYIYNGNVWSDDCVVDLLGELEGINLYYTRPELKMNIKNLIRICEEFLLFCKENKLDCKEMLDYMATREKWKSK